MANTIRLKSGSGNNPSASDLVVGEVALRTDGNPKLFTKNDAGNVLEVGLDSLNAKLPLAGGTLTGNVIYNDNVKAIFGTNSDLEILHNSSENHFNFSANTFFKGNSGWGVRNASNQNILQINGTNRTVELYGGSLRVISTASAKLTVRGGIEIENSEFNMTTNGNKILDFETGGSNFVNFRHNPSDSSNTTFMKAIHGGAVELYHDASGTKTFETTSTGINVTGNITVTGTVDGVDIATRDTLFGGLTSSSGVLTNGVTATTQSAGDNSTKVATTAYTDTAISNLVDSSPSTLNTLNELAAALGDDANFSTTVTNSIATKFAKAGGTLTGNVTIDKSGTANITIKSSNDYGTIEVGGSTGAFIDLKSPASDDYDTRFTHDGFIYAKNNITLSPTTGNVVNVAKNLNAQEGLDVTGNITATGTLDTGNATLNRADITVVTDGSRNNGVFLEAGDTGQGNRPKLRLKGAGNAGLSADAIQVFHDNGSTKVFEVDYQGNIEARHADFSAGLDVTGNITATGEIEIIGSSTVLKFTENDGNPDFGFLGNLGSLRVQDLTNTANLFIFEQNRVRSIKNFDAEAGIDVTGNITVSGTVDGVDIAALNTTVGTKLPLAGGTLTGNLTISNTVPHIDLNDTDNESDYRIRNVNGTFQILDLDQAGGTVFFQRETNADTTITGNLNVTNGIDVTGNITATGTIGSSNITITNSQPFLSLQDSDNENDFEVGNAGGLFRIRDVDAAANRLTISSAGVTTISGNLDVGAGIDVTGAITGTKGITAGGHAAITGTPHTYYYGRGDQSGGVSVYSRESALEVVSSEDSTHGGSLLLRTVTDGAGFVYNSSTNSLELKTFTPSANNFTIHGSGQNVSNLITQLKVVKDAQVELAHNGSVKLATTSTGIDVDGNITCDDIITAGALLHEGDTNTLVHFDQNDNIALKTNGSTRLRVTNAGASITGTCTATTFSGSGASLTNIPAGQLTGTLPALDGSNLTGLTVNNAQTLDNLDSTQFLRSDTTDTLSGDTYTFSSSVNEKIILSGAANPFIRFQEGTTNKAYIQWNANGWLQLSNQEDQSGIRIKDDIVFTQDNFSSQHKIWHAGNDGSGSGLDSDTLDGQEGSHYLDYNNFSNTPTIPTNNNQLTNGAGYITSADGGNAATLDNLDSTQFLRSDQADTMSGNLSLHGNLLLTGTATTTNQSRMIDFTGFDKESTSDTSDRAYIQHTVNTGGFAGSVLLISSRNDSSDGIAFDTNGNNNVKINSNVVWNAGNDGSGSGLDSDKLDGQEGSYYRNASNLNDGSVPAARLSSFSNIFTNSSRNEAPSATVGCLNLKPSASGGKTGIILQSRVNAGSDFGYLWWYDDNSNYANDAGNAENGVLVIGVQNDAASSAAKDAVVIESSGNIWLNAGIGTGIGGANAPNRSLGKVLVGKEGSSAEVTAFPSGTRMIFQQSSAPTGWTKDTTDTNQRALRVVSGNVSSGGNTDFTSAFASRGVSGTIANATQGGSIANGGNNTNNASISTNNSSISISVNNHTLSTAQMPSHTHTGRTRNHDTNSASSQGYPANDSHNAHRTTDRPHNRNMASGTHTSTGSSNSHNHGLSQSSHNHSIDNHSHSINSHNHSFTGSAHNHSFSGTSINLAVRYLDVIIAQKD